MAFNNIIKKNMTKRQYLTSQLEKELWRSSRGKMPKTTREAIAKRTIERMDFNNSYQMHKSLSGYADILVGNWLEENKKKV